jgi:hypothetical protein
MGVAHIVGRGAITLPTTHRRPNMTIKTSIKAGSKKKG